MPADISLPSGYSSLAGAQTKTAPISPTGMSLGLPVTPTVSLQSRAVFFAVIEFLTVLLTACATSLAYNWLFLTEWAPVTEYLTASFAIATLVLVGSLAFRQHLVIQTVSLQRLIWSANGVVVWAFSTLLSVIFLMRIAQDYSRGTFVGQFVAVGFAVLLLRTVFHRSLRKEIAAGKVEARRAVLIGDVTHGARVATRLRDAGIHAIGAYPFPITGARVDESGGNASLRATVEACRALRPHDVVVLANPGDLSRVEQLTAGFSDLPVSLHLVLVGHGDLLMSSRPAELGSVATLQLLRPPLSIIDRVLKRSFDAIAAGIGLIILSPILVIVGVCIKLDSRGPVFFRQIRHGFNNETIRVFKFRSMTVTEDGASFTQAVKNDSRVTRVGRILRRTNLDELPQLLNILIGDMSVVGPRPHPIALNKAFEAQIAPFSRRHNVKPGLTGWAQVNGYRGETDTLAKMQGRIDCDIYYIDNWSFLLDVKIIIMTLFSRKAYSNAY